MSYTRVKFEQTHIIRPASCGMFRRFAQTFRDAPFGGRLRIPLFGALVHYVILIQYTPLKACCQAIFSILGQNFLIFRIFVVRPVPCTRFSFWGLIFCFCTFLPKTPLCILSILALVFESQTFTHKKGEAERPFCSASPFTLHPDNPAAVWRGWDGAACAALLLRSAAPAPGSH